MGTELIQSDYIVYEQLISNWQSPAMQWADEAVFINFSKLTNQQLREMEQCNHDETLFYRTPSA